jgi:putative flippase GtrA
LRLDSLPQFLRFAIGGCIGFCVDATVLYVSIYFLQTGPYLGRAISYICAATSTWYLHLTFADGRSDRKFREWLRFAVLNSIGGAVNYGVYVVALRSVAHGALEPLFSLALASLVGLLVNYSLSRRWVFSRRGLSSAV